MVRTAVMALQVLVVKPPPPFLNLFGTPIFSPSEKLLFNRSKSIDLHIEETENVLNPIFTTSEDNGSRRHLCRAKY